MEITVKSGDEILDILYDDGSREQYDSSSDRRMDFADGEYEVINKLSGHDEFDRWIKRTDVYDYMYGNDED